MLQYFKLN